MALRVPDKTAPAWWRAGDGRSDQPAQRTVLCALLIGLLYFVSARLGLALLAQPGGVAVFWPASGLGAGALVLLGPRGRLPVAAGVFSATIAANLLGDRNLALAVVFGLCNAAEALLFGWLLERLLGQTFQFDRLRAAITFFFAATVCAASTAAVAALAIAVGKGSLSTWFDIFLAWWTADAIGIVMFAPALITLLPVLREPIRHRDLIESGLLLLLLVTLTALTYGLPPKVAESWIPEPIGMIIPLLLWMAARSRPFCLAIGLLLVALTVVWAATHGIGRLGDPAIAMADRIYSARLALLSTAFSGLVFLAVLTERRKTEAALRANDERFSRLTASAPGMICSVRLETDGRASMPFASSAIVPILALRPEEVATGIGRLLRRIHPADMTQVEAVIERTKRSLELVEVEFRYQHPEKGEIWLESFSSPVREADGAVVWHGFIQDISRRKSSEAHIKHLMGEVNHRAKNLLAVVQSVAFHTAREEAPDHFLETFNKRLSGLAASHDLVMGSGWEGVELTDLIRSQLAHFASLIGSRITLTGPPLKLTPNAAQVIGMALHELATNASKYGALVTDSGKVEITWWRDEKFKIRWAEDRGTTVTRSSRRGFGHDVTVAMPEHQLAAEVRVEYPMTGLIWQLTAPVSLTLDERGDGHAR